MLDWWLGLVARNAYESLKGPTHYRLEKWLERSGPDAEYYKVFPQDTVHFQAWENHSVYPYYLLVKSNY
jgi:hypothetical protein